MGSCCFFRLDQLAHSIEVTQLRSLGQLRSLDTGVAHTGMGLACWEWAIKRRIWNSCFFISNPIIMVNSKLFSNSISIEVGKLIREQYECICHDQYSIT